MKLCLDTRREVESEWRKRFFRERMTRLDKRPRPGRPLQRKVLTPNDFSCLEAVVERLAVFERHFESTGRSFGWKFIRFDLNAPIARMRTRHWRRYR